MHMRRYCVKLSKRNGVFENLSVRTDSNQSLITYTDWYSRITINVSFQVSLC